MYSLLIYMQSVPSEGGLPYALKTVNSLGFAVFIIGVMLILLLVLHWNSMKVKINARNPKVKGKMKRQDDHLISQLQFMTKEELRAMVLKEREKAQSQVGSSEPATNIAQVTDINSSTGPYNIPAADVPGQILLFESTAKNEQCPGPVNPEAELLARLLIPEQLRDNENPVPPAVKEIKNPYVDKVERSPRSDEQLDPDNRKSRRI